MQEMILIKSFARSLNSAIEYNVGSVAGSHSQAPSLQLSAPLSLSTMTPMVIQLIIWLTLITFIIYVVTKLRAIVRLDRRKTNSRVTAPMGQMEDL